MFCPNCGKEIDDKAVMCPYCQKELIIKSKNNICRNIAVGCLTPVIILILMATIPYIMEDSSNNSINNKAKSKPKLEVLNSHNCNISSYGGRAICGTVINNTDRTYGYAQIQINLYDKNGTQIGSTMDNINNLAPHTKWDFKAMVIEDRVDNYKIIDVSGF